MDKVLLTGTAVTVGGCSYLRERTTNEMLAVVVVVLFISATWQIGITLWQCRQRRKRIDALLKRRRCDDFRY